MKSCTLLALQAEGRSVETIESVAADGQLSPVQRAFMEEHGLQCGYCTPGMVMTTTCLLARTPSPSDEEILEGLDGNLCRCTGYTNIVRAVRRASDELAGGAR